MMTGEPGAPDPVAAPTPPAPDAIPGNGQPMSGPMPVHRPVYHWYHKMSAVLFITFCLEIGLFLLIFPWTEYWDSNFFSALIPDWRLYWDNMYFRGALSGLGVVDLYISFVEILRLRRFARH